MVRFFRLALQLLKNTMYAIPKDDPTKAFYFFLVVAFMAGFSERFARGVLAGVEGRAASQPTKQ